MTYLQLGRPGSPRLRFVACTALFCITLACSEDPEAQPSATGGTNSGSGGSDGSSGGGSGASSNASGGALGSGGEGSGAGGATASGGGTGGPDGTGGSGAGPVGGTFKVMGRHLYDRCGEQVVLRGVNEMVIWSSGSDGDPEFSEIAKTGANVVRIVWDETGTAAQLDTAISNALSNQLIPMIEHHSATGDLSKVPAVVDYWVTTDVLAVIKKHEADLLLNIANEAGDDKVVAADFQAAYQTHITRLRDAGIVVPLIIDAPSWGQNIDVLQATWKALTAHDPLHNMMYSVHMWWDDATGSRVTTELNESVSAEMPLIVGEFAQHSVWQCSQNAFSYQTLLTEAQKHQVGWLAWSWGGVDNSDCADDGSFDMTVGGVFGDWEETWGGEVAVTHAASIQNTSVRPKSIVDGGCE